MRSHLAPSRRPFGALVVALLGALLVVACSKDVQETATNVLTFQSGAMSELREKRGEGPFHAYPVPPDEMLGLVEAVMKTKVTAVFAAPRRLEVVAKERDAAHATEDWYGPNWRSAVIVFVHPVPGDPSASKLEIHAMDRGPFHKGRIAWERELPPLLRDAATHRESSHPGGSTPIRPLK